MCVRACKRVSVRACACACACACVRARARVCVYVCRGAHLHHRLPARVVPQPHDERPALLPPHTHTHDPPTTSPPFMPPTQTPNPNVPRPLPQCPLPPHRPSSFTPRPAPEYGGARRRTHRIPAALNMIKLNLTSSCRRRVSPAPRRRRTATVSAADVRTWRRRHWL